MLLPIALLLSIVVNEADTPYTMQVISQVRFQTIEQCQNFVLNMSEGYEYVKEGDKLILQVPNGNVLTATCFED